MKEQNQPEYTGLFDAGIVVLKECEAKLKELAKALPYKVQPHFLETFNRLFVAGVQGIYTNRVLLRDLPAHRANEQVFAEHHTASILLENKILLDFDAIVNDLGNTELENGGRTAELTEIQEALSKSGARSKDAKEKDARGINLKELLQKGAEKIAKLREWIAQNADKVLQAIEKAQAAGEKIWALIQSKFKDARLTMFWIKNITEGKFDASTMPFYTEIYAPTAEMIANINEIKNGTAEDLPTQTAE